MKFKKIFLLTIFSAALEQNTFSVPAEPSQATEKAKTQGTKSRERNAFGIITTLAVKTKRKACEGVGTLAVGATAGFIAGVCCNEKIRKLISKLFKKPEKKTPSTEALTAQSSTETKFDFIQAYNIHADKNNENVLVLYNDHFHKLSKDVPSGILFFDYTFENKPAIFCITKKCYNFTVSPQIIIKESRDDQEVVYYDACTNLDTLLKASDLPQELQVILNGNNSDPFAPVVV